MNHEAEQPKSRQPNLWYRLQPVTCTNKRAQMHKWRGRTTNRDVQALELALAQAMLTLYAKRASSDCEVSAPAYALRINRGEDGSGGMATSGMVAMQSSSYSRT